MNEENYQEALDKYIRESYIKLERKPNGMAGNWSFRMKCKEEFDKLYKAG